MLINHYTISKHAQRRMQQRGIKTSYVELILKYADFCKYVGQGSFKYFISKSEIKKLLKKNIIQPQDAERISRIAIVEDQGIFYSVMHQFQRIRNVWNSIFWKPEIEKNIS